MGRRDSLISKAILDAIFRDTKDDEKTLLHRILAFFTFFQVTLYRSRANLFTELRRDVWRQDEDEYRESFRKGDQQGTLQPIGDLGYSGSTFFTTPNSKFMIKSVPRSSEYEFFRDDLLEPYDKYLRETPGSLLVRITDFLRARYFAIGTLLGLAPSTHIIMENILFGKESDPLRERWETYDLKPASYFYPERDIAGGHLASESVKSRLIDTFNDKIRVTNEERRELLDQLGSDTQLLGDGNVVDYSLFLVRFPADTKHDDGSKRKVPYLRAEATNWRSGLLSTDGKWFYRIVLLDFFWAKHKFQAKAMTGLIASFNLIGRKGHMSITTDAKEYRIRFLEMVEEMIEVPARP